MAFWGSVDVRVFIWERTSRIWRGGSVLRVREIMSGHERPAVTGTPAGSGGREEPF